MTMDYNGVALYRRIKKTQLTKGKKRRKIRFEILYYPFSQRIVSRSNRITYDKICAVARTGLCPADVKKCVQLRWQVIKGDSKM